MKRILIAIALCVSLAALAVAQQRTGSLKGQVLDELGGAIVGVTVTAIDAKGVEARYVRLFSNGSDKAETNHYVEVEVYGKPK